MEIFAKMVDNFILDVWQGSEYAMDSYSQKFQRTIFKKKYKQTNKIKSLLLSVPSILSLLFLSVSTSFNLSVVSSIFSLAFSFSLSCITRSLILFRSFSFRFSWAFTMNVLIWEMNGLLFCFNFSSEIRVSASNLLIKQNIRMAATVWFNSWMFLMVLLLFRMSGEGKCRF